MNKFFFALTILILPTLAFAQDVEIFPQNLSSENTIVKFEVDSTWHLIKGVAREVNGRVWISDVTNLSSVSADILFAIKSLDTDNSMRDDRLREVMAADKYPNVRFQMLGVTKACDLAKLEVNVECTTELKGRLRIRDVTKELLIPARIIKKKENYSINGKTSIQWADYGVEDPSILIAKLDKTVVISFEVNLKNSSSDDTQ